MMDEPIIRIRVIRAGRRSYWYNDYKGSEFDVYAESQYNWGERHYKFVVNDWNKSYKKLVEEHGIGALLVRVEDAVIVNNVTNESSVHLLEEEE
jgi:hypothetical protein